MTKELIDAMAAKVAVAMNGGAWATHYNEDQKNVWRRRVSTMIGERKCK